MGFWRGARKIVGHVVDLRVDRWLDLPTLKKSTHFFLQQCKQLFSLPKAKYSESFEEAAERLGLTPEALTLQGRRYRLLSGFFCVLLMAFLTYAVVLGYIGNWQGAVISVTLALYASSLAFRFYFWHFQIKQQKLGCTLRDWYASYSFKTFFNKGINST